MAPRTIRPAAEVDMARAQRRQAAEQHLITKLKLIHKLYEVAYSSPAPMERVGAEFMYAIGDLLEGAAPVSLRLNVIDKEAFLAALKLED